MKAHFTQTGVQFFFHRYLIDSKKLNPDKKRRFDNEDQMSISATDFGNTKTSLHKCRLVQIGQQNLEQWPLYLLKRVGYIAQKKQKKGKSYQVFDQNIKKVSQIRTEYLSYQIMNKSHRVVKMIELINQNPKKQEDQKFFYKFLGRKKQASILNACFILQLCNDGNLEERINDFRNPLNQNQIILYCCQILQGLVEIKKKGILHRDLRPCNIFLHNDQVKFGDFDSAFIYKQSQCSDIKSGIDINTTPQQIVQLASLSDAQLEAIGNLKLYDLQAKCDIYFFGMIIFKMIFKRDYQKKFEGTDIQYLIREKIKQGFGCPKLLDVMKRCLYTNVEKRVDLVTLYDQVKLIQREKYFSNQGKQRTYLSEDPLNLFSYRTLQPTEPQIMTQIQNSINHTFTLSFVSVQYNFEADFQKASLNRSTKLYADEVARVHSKFYKTNENANLWSNISKNRKQLNKFLQIMEDFVIQMYTRAYYYDYLYKVILKINTKCIAKKQQKQIITSNKNSMEKQMVVVLKFLFQILGRTPFKIDKYYNQRILPYETRKLFKDKIKINNKYNFFEGRAKTFNNQEIDTFQMIKQFYNIEYEQADSDNFQTIYQNVLYMIASVDKRLKQRLSESIVDLFRSYDSSKKPKHSQMKEILFILITLQKQKLGSMKKADVVMLKNLLEPLFEGTLVLDSDQAQLFFDNYKKIHKKQVQDSKNKEGVQICFNLLSVSKKHLDCLAAFMAPFSFGSGKSQLKEQQKVEEQQQFVEQGEQQQQLIQLNQQQIKQQIREQIGQQAKQQIKQSKRQIDEAYNREENSRPKQVRLSKKFNYQIENNNNQFIQQNSPLKTHIQVKVYEQESNFSQFDDNAENSQHPIFT